MMRHKTLRQFFWASFAVAAGVCIMTAGCGRGNSSTGVASAAREERKRVAPPTGIARAFTEVSEQAGVAHLHHKPIFEAKVKNIEPWLSSVGAAAAAADYDNDGYVDLYVTNSRQGFPNALYRNNGNGTFTDVAKRAGVADVNDKDGVSTDAVWGDYDNDGYDDLFVAQWGYSRLFHNNRNGTFTDVTEKAGIKRWSNACAVIFFDYNRDGYLDIYVGNYFRDDTNLWHLRSTRIMHNNFETARDGGTNILWRNNGDGTFTDVAKQAGVADTGWTLDVGAADYDNDGDLDLYVANDFGPDKLFRNNGNGTFTDVSVKAIGEDTRKGMNAEFGDFNNDGFLDIYVSNIMTKEYLKEGNMLFRNNGDGTFADIAPEAGVADGGWGWAAKFGDYDNDGDLDIYCANGFISQSREEYWYDLANAVTEPNFDPVDAKQWPTIGNKSLSGYEAKRFFRNEGNESFVEAAEKVGLLHRGDGRGIVVFDYDNDGDLDVYLVNQNQKAALFRNDLGNKNHWVAFKLVGKGDAIGARVKVTVSARDGDFTQIREVDGGNGFCSQSDRRLTFGLGHREKVDSVEIRWANGKRQMLKDVKVNQLHTIKGG